MKEVGPAAWMGAEERGTGPRSVESEVGRGEAERSESACGPAGESGAAHRAIEALIEEQGPIAVWQLVQRSAEEATRPRVSLTRERIAIVDQLLEAARRLLAGIRLPQ